MSIYAQESFVDATKRCRIGENDVYETCYETRGELFRAMRAEYGRCTGKVMVTTQGGDRQVGWIFLKREKYTDCEDTYLSETWVTIHAKLPTKKIEYHYAA